MSKIAVITTGGKQYLVKEGETIRVEKLEAKEGEVMSFDALLVADEAGDAKVGTPTVSGAKVTAKVATHGRADKVMVVKYHAKTRYKRNAGHRQHFTTLTVEKIA